MLIHSDKVLTEVILDGEHIETTPEHPLFTQEKGWLPAGQLTLGMNVRRADGNYGTVWFTWAVYRTQAMYNLTVDTAHTFYVGDGQWLVHNECGGAPQFASPEKLTDHFERHGADLRYSSEGEYLKGAQDFFASDGQEGVLSKYLGSDKIMFNTETEEYGILSSDGIIRTYYLPDESLHGFPTNLDYYNSK